MAIKGSKALPPGQRLEREILQLLRTNGFRVQQDARAAKPRQTDIYARSADLDLLVEVKDRKRKVDISDVDNLRARLRRTASDVVGVLFSLSSLTRGALKEIESDRTREIIVFNEAEIKQLRSGKARLFSLIERKREELRVQGRAWFRSRTAGEYFDVELPESTIEFLSGANAQAYFHSKTGFAHAALAMTLPDSGWGNPGGEGARLTLRLTLDSLDDVRDLFGYLHDRFGLSADGAFSIHQSGACWVGTGVKTFLNAANQCWGRYQEASMRRLHHSEDLTYFDQFRDGWLSFYTRQRVPRLKDTGSNSHFYSSELCIQLPGVPVDLAPFLDLCRYTGNELADFNYVHERRTYTRRLKRPVKLRVVGFAVQTYDGRESDRWIVGLIVRNPFYKKKNLPNELEVEGSPLNDLREFELLLCDLRDHLELGDGVDHYALEGIETTDADHVQVIRPFGTWHKIVRRAKSEVDIQIETERDLHSIILEMGDRANAPAAVRTRRKLIG